MTSLVNKLSTYQKANKLTTKGGLAVVLFVTRIAKDQGLPLNSATLVADSKGQVLGLSKTKIQSILKEYGELRVLAEEGGRTSRGSLGNMEQYVSFLNQLHIDGLADMQQIEAWWVNRVKDFFSAKPFVLKYDTSKSLRIIIRDLLNQAINRQKDNPGTMYAGAILQHLVGAKLSLVLPENSIQNHGFSVSDAMSTRSGDFAIDEVVIHVTTSPGEALMRKCEGNLQSGKRPIIVTIYENMPAAESLSNIQGLSGRVDILEVEQFIATNVYEISQFKTANRKITIERLIEKYNEIVESCETDPSLKISLN